MFSYYYLDVIYKWWGEQTEKWKIKKRQKWKEMNRKEEKSTKKEIQFGFKFVLVCIQKDICILILILCELVIESHSVCMICNTLKGGSGEQWRANRLYANNFILYIQGGKGSEECRFVLFVLLCIWYARILCMHKYYKTKFDEGLEFIQKTKKKHWKW